MRASNRSFAALVAGGQPVAHRATTLRPSC